MIRSGVFSILFLLISSAAFSQVQISGRIVSSDGSKIGVVEIYSQDGVSKFSDADGNFTIDIQKNATTLVFFKEGYTDIEQTFTRPQANVRIVLEKINKLSEVIINRQRERISAMRRLHDIEGTAIYAGRKTEVVVMDKVVGNKAVNNARQILAQVAGLTINENSDGGLQLSIGGRGLNPNRTSNFNTRQDDYDISADVLGYPESYYAPPAEGIQEIQIVRGAASLQYGTQFGGLVNFKMRTPSPKKIEVVTRNTIGSYSQFTNFTSLSGSPGKFSYYTFYNYKQGESFRPNSGYDSRNFFVNLNYNFSENNSLHLDYTYFNYLAHQPGGLTDQMFYNDPSQSNRARNWFAVNWNLFALRFNHKFSPSANFSLQLFGLDASRKAIGYRTNRVSNPDFPGTERDLTIGRFANWGAEARFLQSYIIGANRSSLLIGAKYYQSKNSGLQLPGSSGNDADFHPATDEFPDYASQSEYDYPNLNLALFGENIFKISSQFSITPGFRIEKIRTEADGYYRRINQDLAGNIIFDEKIKEDIIKDRNLALFGIGLSYKLKSRLELYGNVSMNYRSVTFNDIRTAIPSQEIDPGITDEKGYTSDIGLRGRISDKLTFDASVFGLYYNDKIGDLQARLANGTPGRIRKNIGTAATYGFEALADLNLARTIAGNDNILWNVFSNVAVTGSEYLKSEDMNIEGNEVEFVPLFNIKSGMGFGYKSFLAGLQFTYLSEQFSDAGNSITERSENTYGIYGKIPAYYVWDFSASYTLRVWKLEAGINNFSNKAYFTRRATGYPGPGIIPSDLRTFYITLEFRL